MANRITITENPDPRYDFLLSWWEGKVRKRKHVKGNIRHARTAAAGIETRLEKQLPTDDPVTETEWAALRLTRRSGIDLAAVIERWQDLCLSRERSITIKELCRLRELEAERQKLSSRYRADLRKFFVHVVEAWGQRLAADIDAAAVESLVFANAAAAAATLRKRRLMLNSLFAYALEPQRKYITVNPVTGLKTPRRDEVEAPIAILTPRQAETYLQALTAAAPAHLAGEAIGLFAGLRRAEVERLEWPEVRLDASPPVIEVTRGKSKTRTRRLVTVEPCLAAILSPLRQKSGKVWGKNIRRKLNKARLAAGWRGLSGRADLPAWDQNCLRHSFVSYHLAHFGDLALTELQAGHDKDILFEHYRELVTKADAKAFWSIGLMAPKTTGKARGKTAQRTPRPAGSA